MDAHHTERKLDPGLRRDDGERGVLNQSGAPAFAGVTERWEMVRIKSSAGR